MGLINNIYRVSAVFGCQELEASGTGNAGIIANILDAGFIVITAIFAFLFFGEIMSSVEILGACFIGAAAMIITAAKAWRSRRDTTKCKSSDYNCVPNDEDDECDDDDDDNDVDEDDNQNDSLLSRTFHLQKRRS